MSLPFLAESGGERETQIKAAIRPTIIVGFAFIITIAIYGIVAVVLEINIKLEDQLLEKLYTIFNGIAIALIFIILAARKRLYLSTKILKNKLTLPEILSRWRTIDIIFYALAEVCALLGLTITLLGIPFARTFHFFVTAGILILILMPMEMKIKNRIEAIEQHRMDTC